MEAVACETTTLYLVLLHYPVLNKHGEVIGSAITNLDIHDIARMARTYGVAKYFVVSPYSDQHRLAGELTAHWTTGSGARFNPARKEALQRVQLAWTLEEVVEKVACEQGKKPLIVATSAKKHENRIDYAELRRHISRGEVVLLLFGTAHGLADEVMQRADVTLPPVSGGTAYNHLAVRSAASIVVDRLLGI